MATTYVENVGEPPEGYDPLLDRPSLPKDLDMAPLQPLTEETVGLISPGVWSIGSLMFCKILKDGEDMPSEAICNWSDNNTTYYLEKRSPPRVDRTPEGDVLASRYPNHYMRPRGIWTFSENVFCKVKEWVEGMTTEATTIRWVNKNAPSVPTEKLIYDWVDPEWNRTIMISWRVPGQIYQDAWPSLTEEQKLHVADQVAGHFKALARYTSDYVETVEGNGLEGRWSLRVREPIPFWKPEVEPRVSREDYEAYCKRYNDRAGVKRAQPGIGEPLVLQHGDCTPMNFLVTTPSISDPRQMPTVTGIIDWERVGYLPKYQIATTPREMDHFMILSHEMPTAENHDWRWMLSNACVKAGFPLGLEYATECWRRRLKHYPGIDIKRIVCWQNLPTEAGLDEEE